jgi:DNA polymerase (family 10)
MAKKRYPIEAVEPLAIRIRDLLTVEGQPFKPIICGSIRRKCKEVADIDIVVPPLIESHIEKIELEYPNVEHINSGTSKCSIIVEGTQVDIYVAEPDEYGAMVMFLTGSWKFNVYTRSKANKMGLKLNQYGLYRGDAKVAGSTEQGCFKALEIDWWRPERRSW